MTATRLSDRQIEVIIPQTCMPGEFRIAVSTNESADSDNRVLMVRAPEYVVTYKSFYCIEESNPETWLGSNIKDEIYANYAGNADGMSFAKGTRVYPMDERQTRNLDVLDAAAYPIDGTRHTVSQHLYISTTMWETDDGDVAPYQRVLSYLSGLAAESGPLIAALASVSGGTGAAIALASALVLAACAELVGWLFGGKDSLGTKDLFWLAPELQLKTANPERAFTGRLEFLNSDDVGSYRINYTVTRFEP